MQHLPPPDDDALAHSARLREVIQGQIIAAGGSMPFWKQLAWKMSAKLGAITARKP